MISSNDLRNTKLSPEQNGYSVDEVNAVLNEAADTIDGYINENKELYRKMEILAKKIEEYREEEDSIKAALITAQKMADKLEKESNETAALLISKSEEQAKETLAKANEQSEKIITEARDFSANLIKEKTDEANTIIAEAEKKANDAINSSKTVAENILDQAKEISEDLISKSKAEAEAYNILKNNAKKDAWAFIENLVSLYSKQLEILKNANLEVSTNEAETEKEIDYLKGEVNSLFSEIDEIESSIPDEVVIEDEDEEEEPAEEIEEVEEETAEDANEEEIEEIEEAKETDEESAEDEIEEIEETEKEEENEFERDPMKAVEAFSADEITPLDTESLGIPEINEEAEMEGEEEKSLFDDENAEQPFESYFNVSNNDPHYDRSQTISLVPPEDDDEDDQPKFKGFFKKKK